MTAQSVPDEGAVVGLDIGGTLIKSALVGRDGVPVRVERRPTGSEHGRDTVVATVLEHAAQRLAAARRSGVTVHAVGIASCGVVDEVAGVSIFSTALGWRDVPIRHLLADRVGLPVALGHDVRAGGVAEARLGAGRGHDVFLFLPIGTGIGVALMIDGQPFAGAHWRAGELGHIVVRPGGAPCACGRRGCLETVVGGAAIVQRYVDMIDARTAGVVAGVEAVEVVRRATKGEAVAVRVWAEAMDALADALAIAVTLFDPSVLVVGGGLGRSGALLHGPLRQGLAHRLSFQVMPEIVQAQLGDDAGCIGAGLLAWDLLDGRRRLRA